MAESLPHFSGKKVFWIYGVFAFALLVRIVWIHLPIGEAYNSLSRQAITASVVRNYYQESANLFYPQVDEGGHGPYLYNAELPIYGYLMASVYKVLGQVDEGYARLVSVVFSLLMLWLIFRLVSDTVDSRVALAAVFFLSISPKVLSLSRSIQPDMTMLFAMVAAIYFYYRHTVSGNKRDYVFAAGSIAFAILTRVFAGHILIVILYIAYKRDGIKLFLRKTNIAYAFIVLLSLIWYVYMFFIGKNQNLPYNPYHYSPDSVPYWQSMNLDNIIYLIKIAGIHYLTPIGIVFGLIGLFGTRGKWVGLYRVWLISTSIYIFMFWQTVLMHPYYLLPLAPLMAYFIGQGVVVVLEHSRIPGILKSPYLWIILIIAQIILYQNLYRGIYTLPKDIKSAIAAGQFADQSIPKNALTVGSYGTSSIQFYYTNRKGWVLMTEGRQADEVMGELKDLAHKGAEYYVCTVVDLSRVHALEENLKRQYHVYHETPEFIIFDLLTSK